MVWTSLAEHSIIKIKIMSIFMYGVLFYTQSGKSKPTATTAACFQFGGWKVTSGKQKEM